VLTTLLTLLGLIAGCSTGSTGTGIASTVASTPSADVFPANIDVYGTTVHLDAKPTKIVVLGPALTETVFGVGAGAQVVAVDKLSDYPTDAPKTDLDAYQPNVEAIAAYGPDLVLTTYDADGSLVKGLTALKIPVALLPAPTDLDQAYAQFELVGQLTGNTAAGQKLAGDTKTAIAAAVARVTTPAQPITYYWELGPELYSLNSKTFVGSILAQFGLVNIADKAPKAGGDYPQLSAEFIVDADPDVIYLADTTCCQQSRTTVAKRSGWDVVRAVKDTDGIVPLDDDVASRWGPRITDLANAVAGALVKLG